MSRFREQQNQSFEYQVDEILRDLEELKTAQFTGQVSGMLAKLNTNSVKTANGDVVDFYYSNGTHIRTSEIPLSKTPAQNHLYTLNITHRFKPKHKSPVITLPDLKFYFKTDGVSGESSATMNAIGNLTRSADIMKNGQVIGGISNTTGFEPWFSLKSSSNEEYIWETSFSYWANEDVKLNLSASIMSNDSGVLTTEVRGLYNATN